MALQIKKDFDIGISSNNAYAKIESVNGNKDLLDILVAFYLNEESRTNNKSYIEIKNYLFKPNMSDTGENFIKQGYEYLKTLDEYRDAIDLLDN